jgi:heptaprenyl diphosphate synthase
VDRLASKAFQIYLQKYLRFQEILSERLVMNPAFNSAVDLTGQHPGKQLRPRLFFLSARPEGLLDSAVHIAVGIELLHLASITHDDILDLSTNRRGSEALWQSQGVRVALLYGDFLFAEAFAEFGCSGMAHRLLPIMRTLIAGMVRAEVFQNNQRFNMEVSERIHWRIMRLKTARFFAVAAALGAMVSGAPRRILRQAYRLGIYFGLAYQLADDIRDLLTEDLPYGVFSLPALWIGQASAEGEKTLQRVCKNKALRTSDLLQLNGLLKETELTDRMEREILSALGHARRCLSGMAAWNRMRLMQFLNDMQPYILSCLNVDEGSLMSSEVKRS